MDKYQFPLEIGRSASTKSSSSRFPKTIAIIIFILLLLILILCWCNPKKDSESILGAYIDLATGSVHKITKNTITIDDEYHERNEPEIRSKYKFSDPISFEGRPLVREEDYYKQIIDRRIQECNGRYNIATNAFLFLDIDPTLKVTGFLSYDTGDECLIEADVTIKTMDLIRISGSIWLDSATYKNVEYDLLDGEANFNLDVYEDNIILLLNHQGHETKYLCSR